MYKSLRSTHHFAAAPSVIYNMLATAEGHTAMTGAPTEMDATVGGAFSGFGGMLSAVNLELVPNKRIVQMWRAGDWPAGHHSTVTYELSPSADGTTMAFTQTGIPDAQFHDISHGWQEHYWDKMTAATAK